VIEAEIQSIDIAPGLADVGIMKYQIWHQAKDVNVDHRLK
jgi:hypothetical protein